MLMYRLRTGRTNHSRAYIPIYVCSCHDIHQGNKERAWARLESLEQAEILRRDRNKKRRIDITNLR